MDTYKMYSMFLSIDWSNTSKKAIQDKGKVNISSFSKGVITKTSHGEVSQNLMNYALNAKWFKLLNVNKL